MKKIILVYLLIIFFKSIGYTDSPESALFLNVPVGARASALGGAYTSLASGIDGLYWNPAGLSALKSTEILFFRNEYFEDITQHYIGWTSYFEKIKSSIGLSFNMFDYGTFNRTILTSATAYAEQGTFTAKDYTAGLTWSPNMESKLKFGITMNFIKSRIAEDEAKSIAFDIGWMAAAGSDEIPLLIGATIKNFGTKLKYSKVSEDLPLTQNFGISSEFSFENIFIIRPSVDFSFNFIDKEKDFMTGIEIEYDKKFSIQAGYNTINDAGSGFSLGCGFNLFNFQINYAYIPNRELDTSHKFSVLYRFIPNRSQNLK